MYNICTLYNVYKLWDKFSLITIKYIVLKLLKEYIVLKLLKECMVLKLKRMHSS